MNVKFNDFNTTDVAEILGVCNQTISNWCRNGFMRYQDVSEAGSSRPRYLITDAEVDRVKTLIDKYGARKWMLYSRDEIAQTNKVEEPIILPSEIGDVEEDERVMNDDFEMELILHNVSKVKAAKRRVAEIDSEVEKLNDERNELLDLIEGLKQDIIYKL